MRSHWTSLELALPAAVGLLAGCGTGPAERVALAEECVVTDATLAAPRTPMDHPMERDGTVLIYRYPAAHYALLHLPGCIVTPLADVPERTGQGDLYIVPGGARTFPTIPLGRADVTWWYARDAGTTPTRVAFLPESTSQSAPVLSADGEWLAWMRVNRSADTSRHSLAMRHPDGTGATVVALPSLGLGAYELLGVDVAAEEFTVARGLDEFLAIGFDGKVRWRTEVRDVAAQPRTVTRWRDGYLAWDAYREGDAYRMGWSVGAERGSHRFERLRSITHAALDPSGRYAAAGLETQYGRVLSLRDAVVVLRVSDQREIFRRYLPRFTRSNVAFAGDRYFAYSEGNTVRVVRLP